MTDDHGPVGPPDAQPPLEDELPDTPMVQLRERGGKVLAVVLAVLLVVPAGAWLLDTLAFNREGAAVADAVPELADAVALVQRLGCDGTSGTGSGFAVTYDGEPALVTNRHVVDGASQVGLRTLAGGPGPAVTRVLLSTRQDVAVLVLDEPLGSMLGVGSAPAPGDPVRLVGFPGARPITTSGAVEDVRGDRIVLDFPVGPGSSGAPVVDEDGSVVAQVVARTSDGAGVAIAAPAVAAGIDALVEAPSC